MEQFDHHALFNNQESRIEMHLVSKKAQEVSIGEEIFSFDSGETIHTENSYKFDLKDFEKTLNKAELCLRKVWTDQHDHFALTYIEPRKG